MKKRTEIILVIVVVAAIISKFWLDYSRKTLEIEMDMCDTKGNVIHVIVNGVVHRKSGRDWRRFEGEICYDNKVFVNGTYEQEDRLVTTEFEASQTSIISLPTEWIASFSVAERENNIYYFMTYQTNEESENPWTSREDNTFQYFGPASTKEEAEKIQKAWVKKD